MEVETVGSILRYLRNFFLVSQILLLLFSSKKGREFLSDLSLFCYSLTLLVIAFTTNLQEEPSSIIVVIVYFTMIISFFIMYIFSFFAKNNKKTAFSCIILLIDIILIYSIIYSVVETAIPNSFSNISVDPISRSIDCIYFSIMTFAVGIGNVYPLTILAKLLVVSEIVLAFTMIVLVVIFAREKKETVKKTTLPKRGDWLRYRR